MDHDEQFRNDSLELTDTLMQEAKRISDEIDHVERKSDSDRAYYGYLKDFLLNSGGLCHDVLAAAFNDAVLLAMIGTRVLLEDEINILYLETKTDGADRVKVAEDWLRVSNDPKAYKNKIDGKSVVERAEAAGEDAKALYDGEYAIFCSYTHSNAQRTLLNIPHLRSLGRQKAVLASLKAYANILACAAGIAGSEPPQEALDATASYLNKYRASVMEANLPIEQPEA